MKVIISRFKKNYFLTAKSHPPEAERKGRRKIYSTSLSALRKPLRTLRLNMFEVSCCLILFCGMLLMEAQAQTTNDSVVVKRNLQAGTFNCATIIKDAEVLYNNGNYNECLNLLQNGIAECSLSKIEREEAWILITRVNIEQDHIIEADQSLVKLLKTNPNYKPREGAYQQDFYNRLSNITVRPLFSVGVHLGFNVPIYTNEKTYSVFAGVDYSAKYKSLVGFNTGIHIEYEFYKNISFNTGFDYSLYRYSRNLTGAPTNYNTEYQESLKYFSFPLIARKYFGSKDIKPYFMLGANCNTLYKATATITTKYTAVDFLTNESDEFEISRSGIDQTAMRTNTFWGALLGAGCSYKFRNLLFQLDARYSMGVNYFTDSDKRLNNEELIYKYYYVDNAVILNRIEVLASVSYIFKYDVKIKKS